MKQPRPLVAGNWKMNGTGASLEEAEKITAHMEAEAPKCDVMICPPATLLARFAENLKDGPVLIGAQDCHADASGAHTGDISAEMIADCGASAVIVGHSERRTNHGETSEHVHAKAQAAHRAGLQAIICIGETEQERKQGQTLAVVTNQLRESLPGEATASDTVIAYEPVWAIGTSLTPTPDDVAEVHEHIRQKLGEFLGKDQATGIRVLYGGSVKPSNAAELMGVSNVNGALVGGASLKAEDFWGIISAYV